MLGTPSVVRSMAATSGALEVTEMPLSDRRLLVGMLDVLPESSRGVYRERFEPEFEVVFASTYDREERAKIAARASVLLVGWSSIDADLLRSARNCRVIQKCGVGTDKIDLVAARQAGIPVLREAGVNAEAVAEMTILLTLAVMRRLVWAVEELRAGNFRKEELRASTFQIARSTVGLVGLGHVGQRAARLFRAFGAEVMYYDVMRRPSAVEGELSVAYAALPKVLADSDIVSLHVPLTAQTGSLLGRTELGLMKSGAILVNTARGGLVDEEALADVIEAGHLGGAGIDVTGMEPLSRTSRLLSLSQVVVTPHMAGAVSDNLPRVVDRAYANVRKVLRGESVNEEDVVVWP